MIVGGGVSCSRHGINATLFVLERTGACLRVAAHAAAPELSPPILAKTLLPPVCSACVCHPEITDVRVDGYSKASTKRVFAGIPLVGATKDNTEALKVGEPASCHPTDHR